MAPRSGHQTNGVPRTRGERSTRDEAPFAAAERSDGEALRNRMGLGVSEAHTAKPLADELAMVIREGTYSHASGFTGRRDKRQVAHVLRR